MKFLKNTYEMEEIADVFENKYLIKKTRVNPLLENEGWKPKIIEELSLIKRGFLTTEMEIETLEEILESVATD